MIQENRDNMKIITLEVLSKAIANRMGIDIEKARKNAGFVLDIFGYTDRVIDNVLNTEDRQLFYILEEEKMLASNNEDTVLYDGRKWRTQVRTAHPRDEGGGQRTDDNLYLAVSTERRERTAERSLAFIGVNSCITGVAD